MDIASPLMRQQDAFVTAKEKWQRKRNEKRRHSYLFIRIFQNRNYYLCTYIVIIAEGKTPRVIYYVTI